MSIQTYLEKNGYVPIEKEEAFHSLVDGTVIPFSALAGHTIESFRTLVEKEGWTMAPEEEPKEVTIRVLYTPPHCDQFEESKDGSLSCHTPEARYIGKVGKAFGESLLGSFLGAAPGIQELGKSVQAAGLHLSPLAQAWAALARDEEKKRLDQRARTQAEQDSQFAPEDRLPPVPITKEQFEQEYAAQRGETVQQLHERGRFAAPCDCGAGICLGWQMLFDEKIVEARIVEVQYSDSSDGPWIPVAKKENWIRKYSETEPNDK